MRRSIIDHDYNPTLCGLLEVSGGAAGGGSGPGGGPPLSMLYVAPGGNDTTGNGSFAFPYATITKASSVAAPLATAAKPYTILIAPGTYTESPLLHPYVTPSGLDPASPPVITGSPSIAPGFIASGSTGISNTIINTATAIDFGAVPSPSIALVNNQFKSHVSITGTGGGITATKKNNIVAGNTTLTNVSTANLAFNAFNGATAVHATANDTVMNTMGDAFNGGLSVVAAVAKNNVVTAFGSSVAGSTGLSLDGAGVAYSGTPTAIPSNILYANNAPIPTAPTGGPLLVGTLQTTTNVPTTILTIPVPAATTINIAYELVGRVINNGTVGDSQAVKLSAGYKNVGGVVTQLTTHGVGVSELQYDASMNPVSVGVVTNPISGTNLVFQITGINLVVIDWVITVTVTAVA